MSTPSTISRVVKTRRYAAPRELVFRAWIEPEHLKHWFFVGEADTTAHADVDLRVGGLYRVSLHASDGELIYTIGGCYREIEPPDKLVFSWRWEIPHLDEADTLVTVEFRDLEEGRGQSTEVVVTHELLPGQNPCWDNRLDRLRQMLNNDHSREF